MKISCTQENLIQGLQIVSHIASKNNNLPILSNILIKVENKNISLISTNLEIGIQINIRGKVDQDGSCVIDAKLITDFVALLPKERVDLELIDSILNIECQNQKTKINTQQSADFPIIPINQKDNPYFFDINLFKNSINQVIFAAAHQDNQIEFTGILLDIKENKAYLAATDRYRLAEKVIIIDNNQINNEKRIIIPIKTLQEVYRIMNILKNDDIQDQEGVIEVYVSDNQIIFNYNNIEIVSRLLDGNYIDYSSIIPKNYTTKALIQTQTLIKAIKTSSLFTRSGIYDIKLSFNTDKQELTITSSSQQVGEHTAVINTEIEGLSSNVTINYRYLIDGLNNINSDKIVIELVNKPKSNEEDSPEVGVFVIKPEKDDLYTYLILPISNR